MQSFSLVCNAVWHSLPIRLYKKALHACWRLVKTYTSCTYTERVSGEPTVQHAQFMTTTGLYGMNFVKADGDPSMPELTWQYGYAGFWVILLILTAVLLLILRCLIE